MDEQAIATWGYHPTLSAELYPRIDTFGYAGTLYSPPVVVANERPTYTTIAVAGRLRL